MFRIHGVMIVDFPIELYSITMATVLVLHKLYTNSGDFSFSDRAAKLGHRTECIMQFI